MFQVAPMRWRSGVALLILVWALFDLAVPGLCTTEEEGLPSGFASQQEYAYCSATVRTSHAHASKTTPIDQTALENARSEQAADQF
jgi:hypothetical protein